MAASRELLSLPCLHHHVEELLEAFRLDLELALLWRPISRADLAFVDDVLYFAGS